MTVLVAIVVYFVPTAIAAARGHLSTPMIFLINLLLGWTVIGWIIAFIWSLTANTKINAALLSRLPPAADRAQATRPGHLEMEAYYREKRAMERERRNS